MVNSFFRTRKILWWSVKRISNQSTANFDWIRSNTVSGCFFFLTQKLMVLRTRFITCIGDFHQRGDFCLNRTPAVYLARWLTKPTWHVYSGMFKTCGAKTRQRKFSLGFPVSVCLDFVINIFYDVVARIENRCVIKAKYVLLGSGVGLLLHSISRLENCSRTVALLYFFPVKSNKWTDQVLKTNKTCLLHNDRGAVSI